MENRPKVGVACFVIKDGKILMQKRKNSHGSGSWSIPGGHLEFNETVEDCARREVFEETGIKIKHIRKITFTNDIFPEEEKHYVTLFMIAEYSSGKANVCEPAACDAVEWFTWPNLPNPLFIPLKNLIKLGFDLNKFLNANP